MTTQQTDVVTMTSTTEQKTFFTCPAKWRFSHLGLPGVRIDESHLTFGREVHNAIAGYYTDIASHTLTTRREISDLLSSHLSATVTADNDRIEKIIKNVTDWEIERLKLYGKENMPPLMVEHYFETDRFKGYIDCVFRTEKLGEVIVVDWKTGRYAVDEWIHHQLTVYMMALEHLGYRVRQAVAIFVEQGMRALAIDIRDEVLRRAEHFFSCVNNPDYKYPRVVGQMCRWCEYNLLCGFLSSTPIPGLHKTVTSKVIEMLAVNSSRRAIENEMEAIVSELNRGGAL